MQGTSQVNIDLIKWVSLWAKAKAETCTILEAEALTCVNVEAEAEAWVTKPKPGYLYK